MESAAGSASDHRFVVLDGMRGVAALIVMAMHSAFLFPMAAVAVDLFFGLSGFVLAYSYADRLATWKQRRRFFVARLIRFEPLWLIGCAIAIPAGIGMAWFGWADWGWAMLAISIITAPFFVILPYMGTAIPLNPPGWSLTFELIANGALALVGTGVRTALVITAISGPVLFYGILQWDGGMTGWFTFWNCFPRVFFSFFLGVLLQRLWRGAGVSRVGLPAPLVLVATALVCGAYTDWGRTYSILAVFLFNPLLLWFGASSVARGWFARFCKWMGSISYGVYVVHAPLIFTFEGLRFLWVGGDARSYQQSGTVGWIVIPLSILLAHYLTKYVDVPVRAWLSQRLLKKAPQPDGQPASTEPKSVRSAVSAARWDYLPQLDGLRAFAVCGVFYKHFVLDGSLLGNVGVKLFFLLSGFLITGMLLRAKDAQVAGAGRPLRNFYVRRALRLWPAYYLLLLVAIGADWFDLRPYAGWHLLYLSNILFAIRDSWNAPWATAHLWTLSVEEQFYLLWPLVILRLPRRALPWACLIAIALAPVGRAIWTYPAIAYTTIPINSLDTLAGGALLALWHHHRGISPWLLLLAPLGLTGIYLAFTIPNSYALELGQLCSVPLFAAIVSLAVLNWKGPVRWLLGNQVIRYFGRLSYGAYLFHLFVMNGIFSWLAPIVPALQHRGWPLFLAGATLTYILASLSWFLVEHPLNRMKRHFPYP